MIPVIITADRETFEMIISTLNSIDNYATYSREEVDALLNIAEQIQKQLEPTCPLIEQVKNK